MALSPETRLRLNTLGWAALVLIFVVGAPILVSASPLVLGGVVLVGALLGLLMRFLWLFIRRRLSKAGWGRTALVGALALTGVAAAPIYWLVTQSALNPLSVPRVTMTDGKRQVVFQGMIHIGSPQFYRSVIYDMARARDAGYVLFYEGVHTGTPEAEAWMSAAVGTSGDLNGDYSRIAEACGLSFQGDFLDYMSNDSEVNPGRSVIADVSVTEMFAEWQRLVAARPELADQLAAREGTRGTSSGPAAVIGMVNKLGAGHEEFLAAICRGLFSVALGKKADQDFLDEVIVDFRNRRLVDRILAAPDANIYIVYGAEHLPGLFHEMKSRNPSWTIETAT